MYVNTKSKRQTWSTEETKPLAFVYSKKVVNTLPILYFLDDTSSILLLTDKPDYGIGVSCSKL